MFQTTNQGIIDHPSPSCPDSWGIWAPGASACRRPCLSSQLEMSGMATCIRWQINYKEVSPEYSIPSIKSYLTHIINHNHISMLWGFLVKTALKTRDLPWFPVAAQRLAELVQGTQDLRLAFFWGSIWMAWGYWYEGFSHLNYLNVP